MPPRRTCAAMSMSKPAARSAARSAMVALEPGRITRSASPGSARAGPHAHELDDGLGSSGSRSSKLAICGRIGTAMRSRAFGLAARACDRAPAHPRPATAAHRRKNGTRPSASQPVAAAIYRHRRRQTGVGVAAKLVDQEAADQRGVGGIEHRLGADQAGDHAAAVDVADQHHRHVGGARETHVGDVVARAG